MFKYLNISNTGNISVPVKKGLEISVETCSSRCRGISGKVPLFVGLTIVRSRVILKDLVYPFRENMCSITS